MKKATLSYDFDWVPEAYKIRYKDKVWVGWGRSKTGRDGWLLKAFQEEVI